jgi:hypothetical protein
MPLSLAKLANFSSWSADVIENKPGKSGSVKVYQYLLQQYGGGFARKFSSLATELCVGAHLSAFACSLTLAIASLCA